MVKKIAERPKTILRYEELEPRVLFSADVLPHMQGVMMDHIQDVVTRVQHEYRNEQEVVGLQQDSTYSTSSKEIIFINQDVPHSEQLVAGIEAQDSDRDMEVILLDSDENGIEQVTKALSGRTAIDAIHLFSHGSDGQITLGNTVIDAKSLERNRDAIRSWSTALSEQGDILLYGCSVAADGYGRDFVTTLSGLTGADVAASDDPTGSASMNADWNLEYSTGSIEAGVALSSSAQENYQGVLSITVDSVSSTSDDTAATSITVSHTTSGTSRLMLVGVSLTDNRSPVSSITYNGTALTRVGTEDAMSSAHIELWALVAPDVGTHDLEVNLPGGDNGAVVGVITLTGVDQSSPYGSFYSNNGSSGMSSSITITGISSADGDQVFAVVDESSGTSLSPDSGETEYWDVYEDSADGGGYLKAGASSVDMSWSTSGGMGKWAVGAVSVHPAAESIAVASDDSVSTQEDTSVTFDPTSNDTDANGDSIEVIDTTDTSHGTLVDNGDGTYTYTPDADYNGSDSLEYLVIDDGSNLVHYWNLDGDATDSIGTTNGTLSGTSSVSGSFDSALSFDQVDDKVAIPDFTYNNEFSLAFAFKLDDLSGSAYQYIYSHDDSSTNSSLDIFIGEDSSGASAGILSTAIRDADDSQDDTALDVDVSSFVGDGKWHVYTLTVSATNGAKVYIDGSLETSASRGGDSFDPSGSVYLGARQDLDADMYYGNSLDTVQLFSKTLSASEVSDLYNAANRGTVSISISAVNDEQSVDTNTGMSVDEGGSANITKTKLHTSDRDDSATQLVYTVTTAPAHGQIELSSAPGTAISSFSQDDIDNNRVVYVHDDSETDSDSFNFSVDDGKGSASTGTFNITVNPVNDNTPVITPGQSFTVSELAANDTSLGNVAATDADPGTTMSNWTITGGNADGIFSIDSNTGEIKVADNSNLDFETTSNYTLTLTVSDGNHTSAPETVSISVTDEPVSISASQVFSVSESASNGASVGTVATTGDSPTSFSITAGNDDSIFSINPNTGDITVSDNSNLDYETRNQYVLTIQASDGTSTDSEDVTINISDYNEYSVSAVSDSDATSNRVAEDAAIGTAVGITASASDADGTDTVTYSLSDDAGGLFAIDATTGVVTVNGALDYETSTSHTITAVATSTDSSTSTQSFTISVTDVNESAVGAVSDGDAASDYVPENSAIGTAVGITATATDPDGSDTVTYSLDDDAGGRFQIDANTGVITVAGAIDREAAGSYSVTVRATSSDTSSSTQSFTISIGDVDEFDVTSVSDSDATSNRVAEDAAVGTAVGITASASDADATDTITYSLSDDAGGLFAINATTGVVTVNGALDYETATSHTITVVATSTDGSTSTQSYVVDITDVYEPAPNLYSVTPVFDSDRAPNTVPEDAPTGSETGITAHAYDGDPGDSVTYSLSDDANGRFAIDPITGVITVAGALDYETATSHTITVVATSTDGSTSIRTFDIAVTDVNEWPAGAVYDLDPAPDYVPENSPDGTPAGITVSAPDPDGSDTVTYSLDDDAGGRFQIDPATGVITVAGAIDYETAGSYSITVRATSTDASFTVRTFTITVGDVQEVDTGTATDTDNTPRWPDPSQSDTSPADDVDNTETARFVAPTTPSSNYPYDYNLLDTTSYIIIDGTKDGSTVGPYDTGRDSTHNGAENPMYDFTDATHRDEVNTHTEVRPTNNVLTIIHLNDKDWTPSRSARARSHDFIYLNSESYGDIFRDKFNILSIGYGASDRQFGLDELNDSSANMDNAGNGPHRPVLNHEYDRIRRELDDAYEAERESRSFTSRIVTTSTISLTVGIVSYLLRSGSLMASLLSILPLWRGFDPIAVLTGREEKKKDKKAPDKDDPKQESFFDGDAE